MQRAPPPGPADPPRTHVLDAPPVAPEKPLPSDCCESGCERCVFDLYAEEMHEYEAAHEAWLRRQTPP